MNTTTIAPQHTVTVSPVGTPGIYGDGPHRIDCSVCGHVHTYNGEMFTVVEARRHADFFNGKR